MKEASCGSMSVSAVKTCRGDTVHTRLSSGGRRPLANCGAMRCEELVWRMTSNGACKARPVFAPVNCSRLTVVTRSRSVTTWSPQLGNPLSGTASSSPYQLPRCRKKSASTWSTPSLVSVQRSFASQSVRMYPWPNPLGPALSLVVASANRRLRAYQFEPVYLKSGVRRTNSAQDSDAHCAESRISVRTIRPET